MNRKIVVLVVVAVVAVLAGGFWLLRNDSNETPTTPPSSFNANDPSFFGVFEGRVPCTDCERVKVVLILYQDPATKTPTTYVLERIDVGKGNERYITKGSWTTAHGTKTDPEAVVYRLDTEAPEGFRLYQAIDKSILLFLKEDLSLKVGNAGHSYTLSKTH